MNAFPRPHIALLLASALLAGCAGVSTPTRFYSLSSLGPAPASAGSPAAILVGIGPLTIPDYVDRPEIVTVAGPNEVTVNDFHRWSGSLDNALSRTLLEDLAAILPAERFTLARWSPPANLDTASSYRVIVEITRFDAAISGLAVVSAHWVLFGPNERVLAVRMSTYKATAKGPAISDIVAALSDDVAAFSREVAAEIEQTAVPIRSKRAAAAP
jgi:uncharacterized lipoprotein YmbA